MKRYVVWIVVTIILIILSLGLGYYIVDGKFSIFNNKNDESNHEIEENKSIDKSADVLKEVSLAEVKHLYDSITVYNEHCADYYNYYYKNNELTVENMSDDFKISLALYHAYIDKDLKYDGNSSLGSNTYVTEETLKKYFYNIFSSDVGYDIDKVTKGGFKAGYPFAFEDNKFYLLSIGCQSTDRIYKTIVKAKKNNKKIEIYEKIAYLERDWFPSSTGKIKVSLDTDSSLETFDDIDQVTDDTMKHYLDKLNTYKYTFEYIEKDNSYKFVKVEKVQ